MPVPESEQMKSPGKESDMQGYEKEINAFLVEVFHTILRAEERYISAHGRRDLSISEMHVIEAVCGLEAEGRNSVSEIAAHLSITPGSLTTAVNVLVGKGYLARGRDPADGRRVRITALSPAHRANDLHKRFHRDMVAHALEALTGEETAVFAKSLRALAGFFRARHGKDGNESKPS